MIFEIGCRLGGGVKTIRDLYDLDLDVLFEFYGYIRYKNLIEEYQVLKGCDLNKLQGKDLERYYELMGIFEGEEKAKKSREFRQEVNEMNLFLRM